MLPTQFALLSGLGLLGMSSAITALTLDLCSSQNTGTDNFQYVDHYNSNGLCHDKCSGYAFGIVQGTSCWCSNYAPGDTSSMSTCNVQCPGFGYEYCGDASAGVFGYIALGPAPSGTMGASTSKSSTQDDEYSSTQNDDTETTTSSSQAQAQTTTTSSTSSTTTTSKRSTNNNTSAKQTTTKTTDTTSTVMASQEVTTSLSVTTLTGDTAQTVTRTLLQTMTLSSTAIAEPSAATSSGPSNNNKNDSFFSHKGKVAGVFSVVGIVCAAILALAAYYIYKKIRDYRRKKQEFMRYFDAASSYDDAGSNGTPRLDYSDLESNPHQREYEEKRESDFQTGSYSVAGTTSQSGSPTNHHSSFTMDPRLDPDSPLYHNGEDYSNRSLSDDVDYSRKVLKVTNA